VTYFPNYSVVGGYLAYIGWFCGLSGVGLMAGTSEVTIGVVVDNWLYILPGILGGLLIYFSVQRLQHMAVLPTSIIFLIIVFYAVLWGTGTSVEEARGEGWIREMKAAPVWYHTWDYLQLDKVAWAALPDLLLTELGMIFVVALSSSLDVAAIELELNRPLDYNHELKTVGISNIVSGLTGGYTGSYIFSQSVFSLRAGIRSRLAGYTLALCQITFIVIPFPLLSFVPNFFFGSLLSLICVDLVYEWLWDIRTKVTRVEYIVCLATFGFVSVLSVEYGILAGVGFYLICKKMGLDVGEIKYMRHEEEAETINKQEDGQVGSSLSLTRAE
jgi:SulP family sulfate permease